VWLGPTTLVAIHPDSGAIRGFGSMRRAWTRNALGRGAKRRRLNIYFTANLPRQGLQKKPMKADIETIRCIFADPAQKTVARWTTASSRGVRRLAG
jgi:hypothetical protein